MRPASNSCLLQETVCARVCMCNSVVVLVLVLVLVFHSNTVPTLLNLSERWERNQSQLCIAVQKRYFVPLNVEDYLCEGIYWDCIVTSRLRVLLHSCLHCTRYVHREKKPSLPRHHDRERAGMASVRPRVHEEHTRNESKNLIESKFI